MWDALNGMMHGLWEFFTGLYGYFGFWIFVAAMAALALMPPAESKTFKSTPAPTPPPATKPPEDNLAEKKQETRLQRLERIAYLSMISHFRREPQQQAPVHLHIVSPPGVSLSSPDAPQLAPPIDVTPKPSKSFKDFSLRRLRERKASAATRREVKQKILAPQINGAVERN